jgi:hypothetical protein
MKAMYFTLEDKLPVMVIPDADAHMDGHPVLTYSYVLYRFTPGQKKLKADLDRMLSPDKIKNPDYLGTIYFDQPYKAFTYTSDGINKLSDDQVEILIKMVSNYRQNPNLWRL